MVYLFQMFLGPKDGAKCEEFDVADSLTPIIST